MVPSPLPGHFVAHHLKGLVELKMLSWLEQGVYLDLLPAINTPIEMTVNLESMFLFKAHLFILGHSNRVMVTRLVRGGIDHGVVMACGHQTNLHLEHQMFKVSWGVRGWPTHRLPVLSKIELPPLSLNRLHLALNICSFNV